MANTDGIFFHLSEKFCICAWGRVVHNAAPLERQSNADFFTQPAVQMQWLLFIYSPVVNVQISALSYQVSSLCFLSTHWSPPGTPSYYWRGWSLTTCRQCSFCPHSLWPHCTAWCRAKVPALMCCRHACGAPPAAPVTRSTAASQLHSALVSSGILVLSCGWA